MSAHDDLLQRGLTVYEVAVVLEKHRAEVLREAADHAEALRQFSPAFGARKPAQVSENVGILRVAESLRRMADEAEGGAR